MEEKVGNGPSTTLGDQEAAGIEVKSFNFRHKEENAWSVKKLFLEDITQAEFDSVNILMNEVSESLDKPGDEQNALSGIMGLNIALSKKEVYPKICSIILHDSDGEKFPDEFYKSCRGKDVAEACNFFLQREGSSLLSGISVQVLSSVIRRLSESAGKSI